MSCLLLITVVNMYGFSPLATTHANGSKIVLVKHHEVFVIECL